MTGDGPLLQELTVQRSDPGPVRPLRTARPGVDGGDGGLQLIRARTVEAKRVFDKDQPLSNLAAIPKAAVLLLENHELSVYAPRLAARVLQQHQGQETFGLWLVGHQLGD